MAADNPIRDQLTALADADYKAFQCTLMPTVSSERVLGVRMPLVRRLAKDLAGTPEAGAFMQDLPHACYEEDNLHAVLIEQIMDFDTCMNELERFLPYVDNWATCDSMSPAILAACPADTHRAACRWLLSEHPYTVRYGINTLMRYFLKDSFVPEDLERIALLERDEYYIRMGAAWYFATALTWQYEAALPYLQHKRLAPWIHGKTIRKAMESKRIPEERKKILAGLRNGRK